MICIFSVSPKSGACYVYIRSVGKFRVKNATLCLHALFGNLLFFIKECVFVIFISFFDEVSSFCNRILFNQKLELAKINLQWNCMLISHEFNQNLQNISLDVSHQHRYYFVQLQKICNHEKSVRSAFTVRTLENVFYPNYVRITANIHLKVFRTSTNSFIRKISEF